MLQANQQFDHKPARVKGRLLLESICVRCGACKIVSAADESLADWEDRHACTSGTEPPEKSLAAVAESGRGRSSNG
jgi:hypothetical protein